MEGFSASLEITPAVIKLRENWETKIVSWQLLSGDIKISLLANWETH